MANENNLSGHRDRLRGGSRSFFAASLLLPSHLSEPATVLYSFCRVADDLIDDSDDPNSALALLQGRLDRIYSDAIVSDEVDADFAELVREFDIPKSLVQALLEGFMWDATGRQYETVEDLFEYAARVAGSVGVMMTLLMRIKEPSALARAADLGVAMQLTNIARDVAEDAARGRVYLPSQWLCEQGVGINELYEQRKSGPRLKRVVQRLLDTADQLYRRADAGIDQLPVDCQFGIRVARRLYAQIGRQLERNGLDPFAGRAVVPAWRKVGLVARERLRRSSQIGPDRSPPLDQTDFLVRLAAPEYQSNPVFTGAATVDKVPQLDASLRAVMPAPWRQPDPEPGVIALFMRLGLRDREVRDVVT